MFEVSIMDSPNPFVIGDKPPITLKYRHIDTRSQGRQAGQFSVIGASVRGLLHCHNSTPRDDAFSAQFNGKWLVVAVSDGAGSRKNSRFGASFSASRLCGKLLKAVSSPNLKTRELDEIKSGIKNGILHAFQDTHIDLQKFASPEGLGFRIDELHCTLLGLALNVKTGEMGVGQIGDGLILGLDDKREACLMVEPPSTDDPGASYFFTQDDWGKYLDTKEIPIEQVEHSNAFFLMTDGVSNDCQYGPPADILQKWANDMDREIRLETRLQITAERLKRYLVSYKAQGSFDDRTLVVIYKNNKETITS
jgi:serine/threonine protein phosphatase PrpC